MKKVWENIATWYWPHGAPFSHNFWVKHLDSYPELYRALFERAYDQPGVSQEDRLWYVFRACYLSQLPVQSIMKRVGYTGTGRNNPMLDGELPKHRKKFLISIKEERIRYERKLRGEQYTGLVKVPQDVVWGDNKPAVKRKPLKKKILKKRIKRVAL